ncbi:hypothetical protein [Streptosporangium longisporum]|uniref:HTH cro/C1-type domain-containing protein n=1 Tax=Streptosporangium longisporum TaxID=46187 RepID=A0ABP6KZD3_9ACTN
MDETLHTPEDWARLGRQVRQRRQQLDMTQQGLAAAGAPSVTVISKIEGARPGPYDGKIIVRLERALQWAPGSIDAILNGGEPSPVDKDATSPLEIATVKAAIPQAAETVIPPSGPVSGTALNEALLMHLRAMEEQQAALLQEVKVLHKKVDDLQRQQATHQERHETGEQASA